MKNHNRTTGGKDSANREWPTISELLNCFVNYFNSCSEYHRRGKESLFIQSFNEALHIALALERQYLDQNNQVAIGAFSKIQPFSCNLSKLSDTINLKDANRLKRELLNYFYSLAIHMLPAFQLKVLKEICEQIYKRDFLWNFRDISQFNPRIKPCFIYRTATLTIIQNEDFFEDFLLEKKINTLVDLRSERESRENDYTACSLALVNRIAAPIDHLSPSDWKQKPKKSNPSPEEIYRFFALEARDAVKETLEYILKETEAIAIHCHSGKDRTGFLVTLLHLLSGAGIDTVYTDYLWSERDTRKENIDVVLDIILEKNGIENYLWYCGLTHHQISALRKKIAVA